MGLRRSRTRLRRSGKRGCEDQTGGPCAKARGSAVSLHPFLSSVPPHPSYEKSIECSEWREKKRAKRVTRKESSAASGEKRNERSELRFCSRDSLRSFLSSPLATLDSFLVTRFARFFPRHSLHSIFSRNSLRSSPMERPNVFLISPPIESFIHKYARVSYVRLPVLTLPSQCEATRTMSSASASA